MKPIIKIDNLTYEYTDGERVVKAIDEVTLDVHEGEFLVVIGHNGSGKSTLAKHLNAILLPTSGKVYVDGLDTSVLENTFDIRQTAGMVFQNPDNQIVATVVEEDVAFGPENLGIEPKEIRKRVDEALANVGMSEFAKKAPHLLSGGQKQRIAIAGIIAMKPRCIIMDEPTAMLDPRGRKEVMDTVYRLNKEDKITVIHITHFMEEAVNADRVCVMEDGKLIMQGKPREIFKQVDKLKKLGLDVPQMTELAYELRNENIDIEDDILTVEEMVNRLCQ
ncbi:energy-coupling factor transport system ATP-binding protein [Acetoanaerobium noterae]|jgi:energy-coupling factor transport system ATP-binding protein|uniref:YbxA n=2 Tax=Acetoanaerobium TaxID=186831 RepID=E3PTT3_ACESD|nr:MULTISPECIES: energy-coupling factor transporter ATPase [Acetoanaerobium]MBP8763411.1 energy-coupling factor transporter ATPase [Acetoanaerobium sp.]MDK2804437.1 energy-coupling factor transport system ATP-binding protein [Peptostreptococcaceae bacterium]CBH22287.1 YbxA [Acetoanaerobium sticklandii]SKB68722.1 energy-coupling factor transport system ATP-binding protein [Acetoanaerobium noterae]